MNYGVIVKIPGSIFGDTPYIYCMTGESKGRAESISADYLRKHPGCESWVSPIRDDACIGDHLSLAEVCS